jgi:hypothetical protein
MVTCSVCEGSGVYCRYCYELQKDCECMDNQLLVDCMVCEGKGEIEEDA